MNTNSDLPENRPQDSSAESVSSPAPSAATAPSSPTTPSSPTAPTERVAAPSSDTTTTDPAPRRRISKRTWIIGGAVAGVLALGGAGFAIADELNDGSDALDDATRDRVAAAATTYTGGGELIGAERDDDGYDAEVRLDDGTEVDLNLDRDFAVISSDGDRPDDSDSDDNSDDDANEQDSGSTTAPSGTDDRDDVPLTTDETTKSTEAALAETGQGEVVDVDRSDDSDHAFEVEVRLPDGSEVEVRLDAGFRVVSSSPSD